LLLTDLCVLCRLPSQSDMEGEKHKSLNDDTSAESDEKSLVLWRPIAPSIEDSEGILRHFKLMYVSNPIEYNRYYVLRKNYFEFNI